MGQENNKLDKLFDGFSGERPKGEIDYGADVGTERIWSTSNEGSVNQIITQYQVNQEYHNVYNVIGYNFGLIDIWEDGKASNLKVLNGQWIIYKENRVGVTNNPKNECINFYEMR